MVGGLFYLLPSLFGATLVSLFAAFPKELIAALAGVMAEADEREAGLTFLVSVSGMSLLGLSAALWGGWSPSWSRTCCWEPSAHRHSPWRGHQRGRRTLARLAFHRPAG